MHKVNLARIFPNLTAPWSPITVGYCNGVEHRPAAQADTYFMLVEPPAAKDSGTTMV